MIYLAVALLALTVHQAFLSLKFSKLGASVYSETFRLTESQVILRYGTAILLYALGALVQLVLVVLMSFRLSLWPRLVLVLVGIGAISSVVKASRLPTLWTRALGASYVIRLQNVLLDFATDAVLERLQGGAEVRLTPSLLYHRMFGPVHTATPSDRLLSGLRTSLIVPLSQSIAERSLGLMVQDGDIVLADDAFDRMGLDPTVYAEQGLEAFINSVQPRESESA